ncbi:MAG TPA: right-handed parallel beta-helix repeat-containing protein, partial [Verrucomicrobiae bacterium]
MIRPVSILSVSCRAALLLAVISTFARAQVFTVDIPSPPAPTIISNLLVGHGDIWHWRRGTNAPQVDWPTNANANLDATWNTAAGGFGYGDDLIFGEATRVNPGMSNVHSTLYLRRTFTVGAGSDTNASVFLTVDFDDGFVAYLDGKEVARRNVPGAAGTPVANTATTGGVSHEASCCNSPTNLPLAIDLGPTNRLATGTHVLALIGVNQTSASSDFHIIADLALVSVQPPTNTPPLANLGLYSLTTTQTVTLQGTNTLPGSVRVTINGDDAAFDRAAGTWSFSPTLSPGFNRLYFAAHDGTSILTNFTVDIVYEVSSLGIGGVLSGPNIWGDPAVIVRVTNAVTVPSGAALEISPGVVVILSPGASITATTNAAVQVAGTDERRAVFLPATTAFGWLRALGSNAVLSIRHGDVVGGQVRVHNGGSLIIEDSVIRDLPNTGLEVIEAVNGTELTVRRTYMTRFAEGDSQETPVLVEGCLMEGFLVDGMDIKATNAPLVVRRSTFRFADPNNSNADAIDFGPGPGTVENCLIHDFPDKGVSIGGAPGTTIRDTLIYNCGIGISAYASSNLVFVNTTIADCTSGLLFRNNPTRAVGLATNLIVWGNITNVSILQTSLLDLFYSDVDGTNYPGIGNISADPLFVNRALDNYGLSPGSPAKGSGASGADMGVRFPVGGIPSQPARLLALLTTNSAVLLSWIDTAENETGFLVQRSTNGTNWTLIGTVAENVNTFIDASVALGGSYYYRVRATNDVGVSELSNRTRA